MGLFTTSSKSTFPWKELHSIAQLETVLASTDQVPALLFKHSTRCSISAMALNQFERDWKQDTPCDLYYLDLLSHRDVSDKIAALTGVIHQSPQAILIKNNEVIYDASHHHISADRIAEQLG